MGFFRLCSLGVKATQRRFFCLRLSYIMMAGVPDWRAVYTSPALDKYIFVLFSWAVWHPAAAK